MSQSEETSAHIVLMGGIGGDSCSRREEEKKEEEELVLGQGTGEEVKDV